MKLGTSSNPAGRQAGPRRLFFLLVALFGLFAATARADMGQFDVFVGYGDLGGGGIIPEATWFPVVCEIKNTGPTFMGVVEVSSGNYGSSQTRRVYVELPTGSLKRLSIPVFSTARYQANWTVRLLDERGHLRAEHSGLQPRTPLAAGAIVVGALPRTTTGLPEIRQITSRGTDLAPAVARFVEAAIVPDNPLVWEGMDVFYLNSEKAPDLTDAQVNALMSWLNNGGHLVVAVAAISDVNATPWLRSIVPYTLTGSRTAQDNGALQQWLRNSSTTAFVSTKPRPMSMNGIVSSGNPFAGLPDDYDFQKADLSVITGTARNGEVLASAGDAPLMVTAHQGRGRVTVLLFDPERDPFRSWKNKTSFWAKLAGVPVELYQADSVSQRGSYSIDGVFGAMIDSKQIRKLPVEWLLLLLVLYLAVIGPLDQYWLKRIKRPMLTWLTFPCYVVAFSLMIYFIGYKLRAGETEWNELHFVDVLPHGEQAEMRGRTYFSIYSPVNATYKVESQQNFSTFRGEFQGSYSAGSSQDERADIRQANGENFKADIFVPVWTSQLYESDWWDSAEKPLKVSVAADNQGGWLVTTVNPFDHPLTSARVAISGTLYELGEIPAGETRTNRVARGQGQQVANFVRSYAGNFQSASQQRQRAFGSSGGGQILDLPDSSMAVSLLAAVSQPGQSQYNFVTPPGLDISTAADRGQAIFLAWESGASPTKAINQFPTRRSHKDTLWRLVVTVN